MCAIALKLNAQTVIFVEKITLLMKNATASVQLMKVSANLMRFSTLQVAAAIQIMAVITLNSVHSVRNGISMCVDA
jgi:hypothetical protein